MTPRSAYRSVLVRSCLLGAAGTLGMSGLMVPVKSMAQAQIASATSPQFEVVSIKASNPSALRPGRMGSVSVVTTPGRLTARSAYLRELIKGAYGLEEYQFREVRNG
jgi:hypothetical protein